MSDSRIMLITNDPPPKPVPLPVAALRYQYDGSNIEQVREFIGFEVEECTSHPPFPIVPCGPDGKRKTLFRGMWLICMSDGSLRVAPRITFESD